MNILLKNLPAELLAGTRELLPRLGLTEAPDGTPLTAGKGTKLYAGKKDGGVLITYTALPEYFRALSMLPRVLNGGEVEEDPYDGMLCLMSDNSRNAVLTVDSAKRMIRDLALMGFNSLMLYTEDTYELPGYPYFGYLRGRFSCEELREIDAYAAQFGIEVIPCIQALAHMKQALQWQAFDEVHEVSDILFVGEEKTYALIEQMLKTCAACFTSRRINLGMDEAHMLGRGKYLDKHGYRPAPEIMLEHLARVTELCKKYGFAPMIWSDMFFRMAFGTYYVREGEIPPEVAAKIPAGLTLIYWDYYSLDRALFSHMAECHTKLENPVAFAGGAWCWSGFAPCNRFSLLSSEMQLDVCREKKMKDLIVTAWGDDGHEASMFTSLPVLLYFAEFAFGEGHGKENLERRARECFGIGFEELLTLDAPNELPNRDPKKIINPCKYLLFNDPLLGILDGHMDSDTVGAGFAEAEKRLLPLTDHPRFGYMYRTLASLCRVLTRKADFSVRLRRAYQAGDRAALAALADEIDLIVADLDAFTADFRTQWDTENKPFGFETQELRIGGLRARMLSAKERVRAYLDGACERIEELEGEVLLTKRRSSPISPYTNINVWRHYVTACIL